MKHNTHHVTYGLTTCMPVSTSEEAADYKRSLPYLTLPYGEDVLPPSAEASNGLNAHPRINRKVTKSPSAILTWVHTNTWNHPPP